MRHARVFLWALVLIVSSESGVAAGEHAPGAMGDAGTTECGGMMMGGFMILPMLGALLLVIALVLGILALIKYLRDG